MAASPGQIRAALSSMLGSIHGAGAQTPMMPQAQPQAQPQMPPQAPPGNALGAYAGMQGALSRGLGAPPPQMQSGGDEVSQVVETLAQVLNGPDGEHHARRLMAQIQTQRPDLYEKVVAVLSSHPDLLGGPMDQGPMGSQ